MKRLHQSLSIGTLSLCLLLPVLNQAPVLAQIPNPIKLITQAAQGPEILLDLGVARKKTTLTVEGEQVTWQELEDNSPVAPGDVLRYTVQGENIGTEAAQNLAVTQPIPAQMTYRLDSATSKSAADITFSIDQGETFVAEPTIQVTQEDGTVVETPAPADVYTHIRWTFPEITPELGTTAMYEVQVQ